MDPITQGVVGALAAVTVAKPKHLSSAAVIGALAAMSPDLDIVIRSTDDPLLALTYHRYFTHSLLFAPFGAFLCALVGYFAVFKKRQLSLLRVYIYALCGFATHGLIDANTAYGTALFWPWSPERVAWNTLSIIDIFYLVPLAFIVWRTVITQKKTWVIAGLTWLFAYPSIGWHQQHAIEHWVARQQGVLPNQVHAFPTLSNLSLWRVVVEHPKSFTVYAVKRPLLSTQRSIHVLANGGHVNRVSIETDFAWLQQQAQQRQDILRFHHFTNGFIAHDTEHANRLIDVRYAMVPSSTSSLWFIELDEKAPAHQHVQFKRHKDTKHAAENWRTFLALLFAKPAS